MVMSALRGAMIRCRTMGDIRVAESYRPHISISNRLTGKGAEARRSGDIPMYRIRRQKRWTSDWVFSHP